MKTIFTTLVAAAALALPAGALAHHGQPGNHPGDHAANHAGFIAIGSGTFTSGTFKSRALGNGSYTATVAATGAATTTKHGSCAPASGTFTLTGTGTTVGTLTGTAQGKLCTPTAADAKVKSAFFGKLTVTAASGAVASLDGSKGFVALVQKADGTTRFFAAAGKHHGEQHARFLRLHR